MLSQYIPANQICEENWGNGTRQILFAESQPESWKMECFLTQWKHHAVFEKEKDSLHSILSLEGHPLLRTGDREIKLDPLKEVRYPGEDPMESFEPCKLLHISFSGQIFCRFKTYSMEPNIPYYLPKKPFKIFLYCYDWPMVIRKTGFEQNLYPGDRFSFSQENLKELTITSDRNQVMVTTELYLL